MSDTRRNFLKQSAVVGAYTIASVAGLLAPKPGLAEWLVQNFTQGELDDTLRQLYDGMEIIETDKIELKLPRIAENGAVVPITVSTSLDEVESIAILVEKNPVPLAATFKLSPVVDPIVSARIKMAETCDVIAIVKAGNVLYGNRQKVKVTIGGCGG
jgi:sulfur-oxidizing protein SoxY